MRGDLQKQQTHDSQEIGKYYEQEGAYMNRQDSSSVGTSRRVKPATSITRGLNARHIHFIALGSAIGTGLFYGSAGAIQAAGPSVLLVYLLGGVVVYFMLRGLGEMALSLIHI